MAEHNSRVLEHNSVTPQGLGREGCEKLAIRSVRPRQQLLHKLPAFYEGFIGRTAELERLRELFRKKDEACHVAVSARIGTGKAALAREYVRKHWTEYDQVLWVGAADRFHLTSNYLDLAPYLGPDVEAEVKGATGKDAQVAVIRDVLNELGATRLLVFDSVGDREQLREYLPAGPCHVLITTWWQYVRNTAIVHLELLHGADGLWLLRGNLPGDFQGAEHDAAIEVGEYIGWLPQSLKIASGLLSQRSQQPSTLLQELREQGGLGFVLREHGIDPDLCYLFIESFKVLGEQGGEGAAKMILAAGWLAADVPVRRGLLLKAIKGVLWGEGGVVEHDIAAQDLDLTPDELKVADGYVAAMERLGLVEVDIGGDLKFHPAVRACCARDHHWSSGDSQQGREAAQCAVRLLAWAGDAEEDRAHYRAVCAWALSSTSSGVAEGFAPKLWEVFVVRVLRELMGSGLEDYEVGRWREGLKQCVDKLGANSCHCGAAQAKAALCEVAHAEGKYVEAVQVGRAALAEFEKLYGPEHWETLKICYQLAQSLLEEGGQHGEAEGEALLRRALEGSEPLLGPAHPDAMRSADSLAAILAKQGCYAEAEGIHRRALEGRESALGLEHRDTLASVNNLAGLLAERGRHYEAEALFRRVLEGRESLLGPAHPRTLDCVSSLALVVAEQEHSGKAEALHRRALEGRECMLGPAHPSTLASVNNLALGLSKQGCYGEAEALLQSALEGRELALGQDHPDTFALISNLASVLSDQGRYAEAEALHRRALEGEECALGPAHPSTLVSVNNLADVLSKQGCHAKAEALYRRALEGRESALQTEAPVNDLAMIASDFFQLP